MEVDYKEFYKQRKEEILKDDKYCSAEIIIGSKEQEPILEIKVQHVGSGEVAHLMIAMKEAIKILAEKDPIAYLIFQNSKVETQCIEKNDTDKHIPRID